jgi:hypothetical protein
MEHIAECWPTVRLGHCGSGWTRSRRYTTPSCTWAIGRATRVPGSPGLAAYDGGHLVPSMDTFSV